MAKNLARGTSIPVHECDVSVPAWHFQMQVSAAEGRTLVAAAHVDMDTTSCLELNSHEKMAMYLSWKH